MSLERINRHSKSFIINISPRMISKAEKMLSLNASTISHGARSCSRSDYTIGCGHTPAKGNNKEIMKIKSKHRREIMYIKQNMNRRFKKNIKEFEEDTVRQFNNQEINHKKAVVKITKDWDKERHRLESRKNELEGENNILRTELAEYKDSHDSMIKEIERLRKIIENFEEENEAYKDHINTHINMENEKRENMCEECLQTDNLISARYSNKGVGASLKSTISQHRQDSYPNFITLEPNFMQKSVHISTARDLNPSNEEPSQDLPISGSYVNNPLIEKVFTP